MKIFKKNAIFAKKDALQPMENPYLDVLIYYWNITHFDVMNTLSQK